MNTFTKFGTPKEIISDEGNHFCNRMMQKLLQSMAFDTEKH